MCSYHTQVLKRVLQLHSVYGETISLHCNRQVWVRLGKLTERKSFCEFGSFGIGGGVVLSDPKERSRPYYLMVLSDEAERHRTIISLQLQRRLRAN